MRVSVRQSRSTRSTIQDQASKLGLSRYLVLIPYLAIHHLDSGSILLICNSIRAHVSRCYLPGLKCKMSERGRLLGASLPFKKRGSVLLGASDSQVATLQSRGHRWSILLLGPGLNIETVCFDAAQPPIVELPSHAGARDGRGRWSACGRFLLLLISTWP